jgi:hypothetical protein
MVEQTGGVLPGSMAFQARPARRLQLPVAPVQADEPALTAPRLLLLVIVCLLIPGNFAVAGLQLSPNRMLLLGLLPYLVWHWLKGVAGKPTVVDILVLCSTAWLCLSLIVNHGLSAGTRGVILSVELFGGYLVGRMLIRSTKDYRYFFLLLLAGFACLLPFALIENATGRNLARPIFDPFFNIPPRQSNLGMRLGLVRAQTVFEHPILMGIVGSMGVANMLYIYRRKFIRSVQLSGFFVFMVFTTVSSGPMISVGLQLAMTFWDRVLGFLKWRWYLLIAIGLAGLVFVRLASQFHLLDFIIQNFMFNPQTADGRLIILEYGGAEIARNPLFGIGLNDWIRPWYKKPSVDNFWLGHAMRYGIPAVLFLVGAIALSFWRISMQSTLDRRASSYRTGYLITLAGLVVTLGTVYIWGATSVFVMIYVGAGAMFYMRDTDVADDGSRARRAEQARAFAVGQAPATASAAPAAAGPAGPARPSPRRTAGGTSRGRTHGSPTFTLNGPPQREHRPGDDLHV